MATYGNSNKGNTGKKYIKLTGDEVATPEDLARANAFKIWFGGEYNALRKCIFAEHFDDDTFTDTFLVLYDTIALKGAVINNYKFYFLRAYHTARLAGKKRARVDIIDLDNIDVVAPEIESADIWGDFFETEILEYVRGSFDAYTVSIFEMYVGLQPISCRKLALILGLFPNDVWQTIDAIKKDLLFRYADRVGFILSHK